jgi:drug/metabolite transporter (DMT)-like permease
MMMIEQRRRSQRQSYSQAHHSVVLLSLLGLLLLSVLQVVFRQIDGFSLHTTTTTTTRTTRTTRIWTTRTTRILHKRRPMLVCASTGTTIVDSLVANGTVSSDITTASTSYDNSHSVSVITNNVFPIPTTNATTNLSEMNNIQISVAASDIDDDNDDRMEYKKGLVTIGFITLLFSSNSPALHSAFAGGTVLETPPVVLLNGAVSLVALIGLTLGGDTLESNVEKSNSSSSFSSKLRRRRQQQMGGRTPAEEDALAWRSGCELGLWKTLGTVANIWGLALTTASHGALLIQLTTLIVPVVQGLQGVPIPRRIQLAVVLALAGVVCFTQDAVGISGSGSLTDPDTVSATATAAVTSFDILGTQMSATALGDALCVVAAIFYSVYDLRLFEWGKQVPARALITRKIATQAFLSFVLLVVVSGSESLTYMQTTIDAVVGTIQQNVDKSSSIIDCDTSSNLKALVSLLLVPAVVLWSGIAVNAVAPYLQVGGQQAVGPTRAQTIYASQPLWAAMLSYVFLGETIGQQGLVGGSIFIAALFLAATAEVPDPDCGSTNCEI